MALPADSTSSWMGSTDAPSGFLGTGADDYELYEDDGEFVLSVELPGFEPEDITVSWDEGVLNVAAERDEDARGRRRTYHRRFRFPKNVDDGEITAEYTNGILEVRLPVLTTPAVSGREIEVQT